MEDSREHLGKGQMPNEAKQRGFDHVTPAQIRRITLQR